eukprot:scaffold20665_cov131-Skeletonema_marinoi.AAC.1
MCVLQQPNVGWTQALLEHHIVSHAKHLYYGSSIGWTCRRRYNVVGDLMRPSGSPQASQMTAISYLTL